MIRLAEDVRKLQQDMRTETGRQRIAAAMYEPSANLC